MEGGQGWEGGVRRRGWRRMDCLRMNEGKNTFDWCFFFKALAVDGGVVTNDR